MAPAVLHEQGAAVLHESYGSQRSRDHATHGLAGALGRLNVVMEAYPDLKANQNMMQLSEELTATENKVAFSRQAFNDQVMAYNTYR